jgi:hypothetical protein
MGSYAGLYFDNIQANCDEDAAPSVFRILFSPSDFLQISRRKLPAHLRAFYKRGRYYFGPDSQIYSVLYGLAAAAERRLSILGYSRSRAEEAWNSAKIELIENAERDGDPSYENLRAMRKAMADRFGAISYNEWQKKYTDIFRAKANGHEDNSAETFLFLEGLRLTEMASDPLMWVAIQLYAFEPAELCADITDLIESEYETKESIFGEDEAPSRWSCAFGRSRS